MHYATTSLSFFRRQVKDSPPIHQQCNNTVPQYSKVTCYELYIQTFELSKMEIHTSVELVGAIVFIYTRVHQKKIMEEIKSSAASNLKVATVASKHSRRVRSGWYPTWLRGNSYVCMVYKLRATFKAICIITYNLYICFLIQIRYSTNKEYTTLLVDCIRLFDYIQYMKDDFQF